MLGDLPIDLIREIAKLLSTKEIARLAILSKACKSLSTEICTAAKLDWKTPVCKDVLRTMEPWLSRQIQLQSLELHCPEGHTFKWPDCQALSCLTSLRSLEILCKPDTPRAAILTSSCLEPLTALTQLTHLAVNCDIEFELEAAGFSSMGEPNIAQLNVFASFERLESLRLCFFYSYSWRFGIRYLSPNFKGLLRLRHLSLDMLDIRLVVDEELCITFARLTELNLSCYSVECPPQLQPVELTKCTALKHTTDDKFGEDASFPFEMSPSLRKLDLWRFGDYVDITNPELPVSFVPQSILCNITELTLSKQGGMGIMQDLQAMQNLRILTLYDLTIFDSYPSCLDLFAPIQSLEQLKLGGPLPARAVRLLTMAPLPYLKHLHLLPCEEGVQSNGWSDNLELLPALETLTVTTDIGANRRGRQRILTIRLSELVADAATEDLTCSCSLLAGIAEEQSGLPEKLFETRLEFDQPDFWQYWETIAWQCWETVAWSKRRFETPGKSPQNCQRHVELSLKTWPQRSFLTAEQILDLSRHSWDNEANAIEYLLAMHACNFNGLSLTHSRLSELDFMRVNRMETHTCKLQDNVNFQAAYFDIQPCED